MRAEGGEYFKLPLCCCFSLASMLVSRLVPLLSDRIEADSLAVAKGKMERVCRAEVLFLADGVGDC